jgi:hypothetical protein
MPSSLTCFSANTLPSAAHAAGNEGKPQNDRLWPMQLQLTFANRLEDNSEGTLADLPLDIEVLLRKVRGALPESAMDQPTAWQIPVSPNASETFLQRSLYADPALAKMGRVPEIAVQNNRHTMLHAQIRCRCQSNALKPFWFCQVFQLAARQLCPVAWQKTNFMV